MSNVSHVHQIVAFDSAKSKPFDGQRLSKISYKAGKDGSKKSESMCVSIPVIPVIEIQDNIQAFVGYVHKMVLDAQDSMVKEMYESGLSNINEHDIDIAHVIEWMDQQSSGSRLTKEEVIHWFDSALADTLSIAFADKLGVDSNASNLTPEMEQRIVQGVNVYRDKISSLAGGKTRFAPEICDKLIKALEYCGDDDVMKVRFVRRLEDMKSKAVNVDMLGL